MKNVFFRLFTLFLFVQFNSSCGSNSGEKGAGSSEPKLKIVNTNFSSGGVDMNAYVAYNENYQKKMPAILVVPEWWGMNDYVKRRARELAELGYVGMAIDMYGNGKIADNPDTAGTYATPFYQDPQLAKDRIDAAIAKLKTYPAVDTSQIGAIGYCFGGGVLINTARMGDELKGIVSFHGNLIGTPADKSLLKTKILVCQGGADQFVPEKDREEFKKQMDSIGADYTYKEYEGATHSFTNPAATELGKKFNMPISYNPSADTASWNDMKIFFDQLFQ